MITDGIVQALTDLASNEGLQCYFTEFLPSNMGHINVKLCRPYWFSQCIKEVSEFGNSYGAQPPSGESIYMYTHDAEADIEQNKTACFCKEFHRAINSPISKARGIVLASVLYNILTTVGHTVVCCDGNTPPSSIDQSTFKSRLHGPAILPYLCDHASASVCCIDVRKYLMERNLIGKVVTMIKCPHDNICTLGRGGFSSDLDTVTGKACLCIS